MPSQKGPSQATSNARQWVVVQLSGNGEHEKNLLMLEKSVRRILKRDIEIFIPAVTEKVREDNHTMFYMDGYIFILFVHGVNYNKLSNTTYFETVLMSGRDKLSLLDDSYLVPLRKGTQALKLGTFAKGDKVKVVKGTFKNLTGVISAVYENGEKVQLNLNLSSKPLLIDYPSSYLTKLACEP